MGEESEKEKFLDDLKEFDDFYELDDVVDGATKHEDGMDDGVMGQLKELEDMVNRVEATVPDHIKQSRAETRKKQDQERRAKQGLIELGEDGEDDNNIDMEHAKGKLDVRKTYLFIEGNGTQPQLAYWDQINNMWKFSGDPTRIATAQVEKTCKQVHMNHAQYMEELVESLQVRLEEEKLLKRGPERMMKSPRSPREPGEKRERALGGGGGSRRPAGTNQMDRIAAGRFQHQREVEMHARIQKREFDKTNKGFSGVHIKGITMLLAKACPHMTKDAVVKARNILRKIKNERNGYSDDNGYGGGGVKSYGDWKIGGGGGGSSGSGYQNPSNNNSSWNSWGNDADSDWNKPGSVWYQDYANAGGNSGTGAETSKGVEEKKIFKPIISRAMPVLKKKPPQGGGVTAASGGGGQKAPVARPWQATR